MARRSPKSAARSIATPAPATETVETHGPNAERSSPKIVSPLGPLWRTVLSAAIVVHLTAVFSAPLNERPSSSILTRTVVGWLRPYLDAAYLNHGYGFFSPDPGSSIIVRYALTMPDGTTKSGVMPDLAEHWPRLLYHRQFMLTSQAHMFGLPSDENPDGLQLPQAYARHLKQTNGAQAVRLEFVEHRPSSPDEIIEGNELSNADTYRVLATVALDANDKVTVRQIADESLPEPGSPPTFGPDQGPPIPLRRPGGAPPAGDDSESFDQRPPYGPFPVRPNRPDGNPASAPEEVR